MVPGETLFLPKSHLCSSQEALDLGKNFLPSSLEPRRIEAKHRVNVTVSCQEISFKLGYSKSRKKAKKRNRF